jgi:hypothetical protein
MTYGIPSQITPPWKTVSERSGFALSPRWFVSGPHFDNGQALFALRDPGGSWQSLHPTREAAETLRDKENA